MAKKVAKDVDEFIIVRCVWLVIWLCGKFAVLVEIVKDGGVASLLLSVADRLHPLLISRFCEKPIELFSSLGVC